MVRGYGISATMVAEERPAELGVGVGDNGGVESALLGQLVAAGGPAAQSCLRWVVFGESLPADPGCLDVVWSDRPMTL